MPLDCPTCFKQLQHLEQEGAVQPDLSSFGKKNCMYGHTGKVVLHFGIGRWTDFVVLRMREYQARDWLRKRFYFANVTSEL